MRFLEEAVYDLFQIFMIENYYPALPVSLRYEYIPL